MQWQGVAVLLGNVIEAPVSMQGLRDPFFLSTKKNTAPAGYKEGWIIPAAKALVICVHSISENE